jgi:hypothetical protein
VALLRARMAHLRGAGTARRSRRERLLTRLAT